MVESVLMQRIVHAARDAADANGVAVSEVMFERDPCGFEHTVIVIGCWKEDGSPAKARLSVGDEALEDYGVAWCVDQIIDVMPYLFRGDRELECRLLPGSKVLAYA